MKRYSSGLYARLGFAVAIHSQSRHRAGRRGARRRRRGVPAPRARGAAPADRRRQDRALHLARHVERAPAVRSDPVDGRRPRARLRTGRRDRRALHERGQRRRRSPTRRPRCRAIAAAPARSATPPSTSSTRPARRPTLLAPGDDARRARGVSRRAAGRAAGVSGRASSTSTPAWSITTATSRPADVPDDGRRRGRRSSAGFRGCRCGRGSTCCGCRSPTAISSRPTTW